MEKINNSASFLLTTPPLGEIKNPLEPSLETKRADVASDSFARTAVRRSPGMFTVPRLPLRTVGKEKKSAAASAYIKTAEVKYSVAFYAFINNEAVAMPAPLGKDFSNSKIQNQDLAHVKLLLGTSDHQGTRDAAGWVSSILTKETALDLVNTQNPQNVFLKNVPIRREKKADIKKRFSDLIGILEQFHQMRQVLLESDLGVLGMANAKDGGKVPEAGIAVCREMAVHILSRLKETGRVMFPIDYWSHYAASDVPRKLQPGHSTVGMIEKISGSETKAKLSIFETNGVMTYVIARDAVVAKRTNKKGEEIRSKKLGLSDFTLDKIIKRPVVDSENKPKTFPQVCVTSEYKSLRVSNSGNTDKQGNMAELAENVETLARLLGPNWFFANGTLQEVTNTLEYELSLSGVLEIPVQRMHSVQGKANCELKSISVAVSNILDDECSYQCFQKILGEEARRIVDSQKSSLVDPLAADEVETRLQDRQKGIQERLNIAIRND